MSRSLLIPGVFSSCCAVTCLWTPWLVVLLSSVIRTPLPYTPTLLPDNFTVYTTYTLLDARAEYGLWGYSESGDILKVDSSQDKTRNSTFGYHNQQYFSAVSCTFNVYGVVTGYSDSGVPQGDVYPQLEMPGCASVVAFRGLLIVLLILPFLSICLAGPGISLKDANHRHESYLQHFVDLGGDEVDGDEERSAQPPESPSSVDSSNRPVPPPPYYEPGCTLDIPDLAAPQSPALPHPPAAAVVHPGGTPELGLPPAYQPPPIPAQPPRRLRRYPVNSTRPAQKLLQEEGNLLHTALFDAGLALLFVVLGLGIALGSLGALFGFLNDSGFGEPRKLLWPVWLYLSTIVFYVLTILIECLQVAIQLRVGVQRYLQEDGASWQVLMRPRYPWPGV